MARKKPTRHTWKDVRLIQRVKNSEMKFKKMIDDIHWTVPLVIYSNVLPTFSILGRKQTSISFRWYAKVWVAKRLREWMFFFFKSHFIRNAINFFQIYFKSFTIEYRSNFPFPSFKEDEEQKSTRNQTAYQISSNPFFTEFLYTALIMPTTSNHTSKTCFEFFTHISVVANLKKVWKHPFKTPKG